MARCNWLENTVHRTRVSVGERLLQELQFQDARRIPERRNLLFVAGSTRADRALACLFHHGTPTLIVGLQNSSTRGTPYKKQEVWRNGNRYAIPTSPHPRRRRNRCTNRCATRAILLVQITGQPTPAGSDGVHQHESHSRAASRLPKSSALTEVLAPQNSGNSAEQQTTTGDASLDSRFSGTQQIN